MRTHKNKITDRLQADANTYAPGERKQLLLDAKQEIINLRAALKGLHEIAGEAVEYGLSESAEKLDDWFREHRHFFLHNEDIQ